MSIACSYQQNLVARCNNNVFVNVSHYVIILSMLYTHTHLLLLSELTIVSLSRTRQSKVLLLDYRPTVVIYKR